MVAGNQCNRVPACVRAGVRARVYVKWYYIRWHVVFYRAWLISLLRKVHHHKPCVQRAAGGHVLLVIHHNVGWRHWRGTWATSKKLAFITIIIIIIIIISSFVMCPYIVLRWYVPLFLVFIYLLDQITERKYTILSTAVSTNGGNLLLSEFEIYRNQCFNVNSSHKITVLLL